MKRLLSILVCLALLMGPGAAFANGYEPTDEYTLPGIVFTDRPEDFTGIWRCRYFVRNGTVCTFSSFVETKECNGFCFVYEGEKLPEGSMGLYYYEIIDLEKICEIWGPLCQTSPFLLPPPEEIVPGRRYLLQDGNMIQYISYENEKRYEAFVFFRVE